MSIKWPAAKDPNEVLDYQIDWTSRLEGDNILTSTFEVVTGTVLINSDKIEETTNKKTILWLSGGTHGEDCAILNRIATEGGRIMDQTVVLRVRTK